MRTSSLLILTLTVMLFSQCKKDDAPCEINIPEFCNLVDLSDEYAPVCGCDGETYQNAGWAQCVGGVASFEDGRCK